MSKSTSNTNSNTNANTNKGAEDHPDLSQGLSRRIEEGRHPPPVVFSSIILPVVRHGQEPRTQKCKRARKRRPTRPIEELNAELDAHVASGLIQEGTFSLDYF